MTNNIFSKILTGEIPSEKIYENEFVFAFKDIKPQAKVHFLVIPKKFYTNFHTFTQQASINEKIKFWDSVSEILQIHNLQQSSKIISNLGKQGGQEIDYFHVHILGL